MSSGRMPANVSVRPRANVTAGFANEVEAVNQYADVMYAAIANGTMSVRRRERSGIEVRARDWAESENQSYECGTCRNGVGKERDCLVAGRQAIRHDARPNNRCQQ